MDQSSLTVRDYDPNTFRPNDAGMSLHRSGSETDMTIPNDIAGTAALSICESLLLAMNDRKILPENEILGILTDAAAAHEFAPGDDRAELHAAVAALINGILAGGNSVRRH